MRIIWGTVYTVVITAVLAGTFLVADSVATHSTPLAISGLVVYLMGIASLRVSIDARWLKETRARIDRDREQLTRDRIQLAAEREVFASECARTQRDLETQERRGTETLAAERARMLADLEAEREAMTADLEEQRAQIERRAVAVGIKIGRQGVARGAHTRAKVVALPIPAPAQGTIGSDILSN